MTLDISPAWVLVLPGTGQDDTERPQIRSNEPPPLDTLLHPIGAHDRRRSVERGLTGYGLLIGIFDDSVSTRGKDRVSSDGESIDGVSASEYNAAIFSLWSQRECTQATV